METKRKRTTFDYPEKIQNYNPVFEDGFTVHFAPKAYMTGGGVYRILNKKTGDFYIGSTKSFDTRFRGHKNQLKSRFNVTPFLQSAVREFGIENFCFTIIEHVKDATMLIEREQYYIDKLNPSYNVCKIANSAKGVKRTDITKERIRSSISGVKHPEWRRKQKGDSIRGDRHWTKRKKHSEEGRIALSEGQKKLYARGYINPLKGSKKTPDQLEIMRKNASVPVIQFTMSGEFIAEYPSMKQASLETGIDDSGICEVCNGKQKHAGNFLWKKKE